MKKTTILAIALGLGSLAACNKSPQQQAADNYEANADNAADAMKSAADNKSDAMKNAADNKADAIKNKQ